MTMPKLIALLLAVVPQVAAAQRSVVDSAEVAAERSLRAYMAGDYLLVARHTDPAELRRNRTAFDTLLRRDSSNYIAQRLFRLDSTTQLLRLNDVEFTLGLMTFWMGVNRVSENMKAVADVEVVGSVHRGRDTTQVVYRWIYKPTEPPMRSYQVETMIRCGNDWCSAMAGDYRSLVKLLGEPMVPVGPVQVKRPPF